MFFYIYKSITALPVVNSTNDFYQ